MPLQPIETVNRSGIRFHPIFPTQRKCLKSPLGLVNTSNSWHKKIEVFNGCPLMETQMIWAIDARLDQHPNVLPAKHIDVCGGDWGHLSYDVLFCANMIHISPWESSIALFSHANPAQYIILYGPFMNHGKHNSQGNAQFDVSLKSRDPRWGIRRSTRPHSAWQPKGFVLHTQYPMPANNFTLIWKRT